MYRYKKENLCVCAGVPVCMLANVCALAYGRS